jgi:Fic family protein
MFLPEYTITNKTLQHISQIEFSRAVIENTAVLPNWEKQLKKEARIREIVGSLRFLGQNVNQDEIKKYLDGIKPPTREMQGLNETLNFIETDTNAGEIDEKTIKELYKKATGSQSSGFYRKRKAENTTHPEEILAEMVEFMDWYHSLDAQETHPVILAGILYAKLETIVPFEQINFIITNLVTRSALKNSGYGVKDFYCLEEWFTKSKGQYERLLYSIFHDQEYTEWLEYFTESLSIEFSNTKEKVILLARDTKVAKASGRVKLTDRQERIIEYLQDYGLLQNKDFPRVFPGISEDSVLRI